MLCVLFLVWCVYKLEASPSDREDNRYYGGAKHIHARIRKKSGEGGRIDSRQPLFLTSSEFDEWEHLFTASD